MLIRKQSTSRYLRVPYEAQIGAALLATIVYALVLCLICFFAFVAATTGSILISIISAVVVASIVFFWFPRFGKLPDDAVFLDRKTMPILYQLIDEISATYGIEAPEVWLSEDFTAGYARLGVRRKPTLLLGYSMLAILDKDELLTLMAHELAHAFDGTVTRSVYVSNVASALFSLKVGLYSAAKYFDKFLPLKPIAWMFYMAFAGSAEIGRCLQRQISKEYRHAEYVADYHALRLSGKRDISELLFKLSTGMLSSIRDACVVVDSAEKYTAIHTAFNAISERERRNIWAYVINQPGDPYARHPRSVERIAFLQRFTPSEPQIVLTADRFAAIQDELYRWPSHSTTP